MGEELADYHDVVGYEWIAFRGNEVVLYHDGLRICD